MRAVTPDGERYSPLLQTRAEVFRPVDRINDCDPALERRGRLGLKSFLADHPHSRQYALKEAGHLLFQKQIGICHRASVRLPDDLVTQGQKGRHKAFRQVHRVLKDSSDLHENLVLYLQVAIGSKSLLAQPVVTAVRRGGDDVKAAL